MTDEKPKGVFRPWAFVMVRLLIAGVVILAIVTLAVLTVIWLGQLAWSP